VWRPKTDEEVKALRDEYERTRTSDGKTGKGDEDSGAGGKVEGVSDSRYEPYSIRRSGKAPEKFQRQINQF